VLWQQASLEMTCLLQMGQVIKSCSLLMRCCPPAPWDCALLLTLHHGLVARASHDCEGPVAHVLLHDWVAEVAADQALGVKHCVPGVHGHLVLGCGQANTRNKAKEHW
jgi:hypothetical protein